MRIASVDGGVGGVDQVAVQDLLAGVAHASATRTLAAAGRPAEGGVAGWVVCIRLAGEAPASQRGAVCEHTAPSIRTVFVDVGEAAEAAGLDQLRCRLAAAARDARRARRLRGSFGCFGHRARRRRRVCDSCVWGERGASEERMEDVVLF
jgi:hypothetical protein